MIPRKNEKTKSAISQTHHSVWTGGGVCAAKAAAGDNSSSAVNTVRRKMELNAL
jgi:hypothetical protein